jgi:hypothetical protein
MIYSVYPEGKVSFAIGTGRCGTKFIYELLKQEKDVASFHERNPLSDTFHRYCKWYGINVDHEGFLATKESEIQTDLSKSNYSFEASAYLSLSVEELFQRFNAKFVLLVRNPQDVVTSYLRKGWYNKPFIRAQPDLPPTYQDCKYFHHFLGRIVPSGEKFIDWQNQSRVGKLAWYWNALNAQVIDQFSRIPLNQWRIQKLEDFSYKQYLSIAEFLGITPTVSQAHFDRLVSSRPNASSSKQAPILWDTEEIKELEVEARPMAEYFGYEIIKPSNVP